MEENNKRNGDDVHINLKQEAKRRRTIENSPREIRGIAGRAVIKETKIYGEEEVEKIRKLREDKAARNTYAYFDEELGMRLGDVPVVVIFYAGK